MCGICGFIDPDRRLDPAAHPALIAAMAEVLGHRGPDDAGCWCDPSAAVALGHRRLAIIDVSPQGHQPMLSGDGRIALTFNGEIYNYRELRRTLAGEGCRFRGLSDTEVLVEALAYWGPERTLARLNGIFAFAAWDIDKQRLILARDHLGIKPLYWGRFGAGVFFASELKALRAVPGWSAAIEPSVQQDFLRYGHVPGVASIYRGIRRLPAGVMLTWTPSGPPSERPFYDLSEVFRQGRSEPLPASDDALVERLQSVLDAVLADQMVADVSLGAFLSGGIDSSTIVALMQRRAQRPVCTFTIGFSQRDFDEARHAAAIARHLGTEHTELYVGEHRLLDLVPKLVEVYDEPFADASQLPTLLLSELARRSVTVALSGDGGDELFAGYNRHLWGGRFVQWVERYPLWLRRLAAGMLARAPSSLWQAVAAALPARQRPRQLGDKMHKLARLMTQSDLPSVYEALRSLNPQAHHLLGRDAAPPPVLRADGLDPVTALQLADALSYLPDDLLTKVDRASMHHALEVRVPLLDLRLVSFAARLPPAFKVRGGRGKWLLRRLLHRHVPARLVERPKSGFTVPMDAWLRGPLRDWAQSLLEDECARPRAGLDGAQLRRLWQLHQAGSADLGHCLWPVVSLLAWHARWLP